MRHICSSINKTLSTCVEPVLKLEILNDEQEKKICYIQLRVLQLVFLRISSLEKGTKLSYTAVPNYFVGLLLNSSSRWQGNFDLHVIVFVVPAVVLVEAHTLAKLASNCYIVVP